MPPKKRKSRGVTPQPRKRMATKKAEQTSETQEAGRESTQHPDIYDKVFRTTELLEAILEWLPPTSLYSIQRVNKQFQTVIVNSPRIQRKMFYRIDNKRVVGWHFRYDARNSQDGEWVFESDSVRQPKRLDQLTPVVMNSSLSRDEAPRRSGTRFLWSTRDIIARGEILQIPSSLRLTLQQIDQPRGILNTFLSDPHCPAIELKLNFALGVRSPTIITFTSMVRSDTPLTIGAIIAEALNTHNSISISWGTFEGHISPGGEYRKGIPRQVINKLKRKARREAYLMPLDSTFLLCRFVAPTEDQEVSANTRRAERPVSSSANSDGELYEYDELDSDLD